MGLSDMDDYKKNSKKGGKKKVVGETLKMRLIAAGVIAFLVIVIGGFFAYNTGLPAKILTGATIAGQDVKVNVIDYEFQQVYSMYYQYGLVTSKEDLDKVYDTTSGKTYREYFYEQAATRIQQTILLNREAKAAGFKAESVDNLIDQYLKTIREYAKSNNTTAEAILRSRYGSGMTVRTMRDILRQEYTAEEYTAYLKQNSYTLTDEQMQDLYDKSPADYDKVTYNTYFFSADIQATETDEAVKTAALNKAKDTAQGVIDSAKDATSFRDACETAAGDAGASSFANGADPTLAAASTKDYVTSYVNADVATWLFDDARKDGDKTIIKTDSGYYAVFFQTRELDTTSTYSYRVLTLDGTDITALHQKLQDFQAKVTDENSFVTIVKKNSDASTADSGGLVSGIKESDKTSSDLTDVEKTLYAWLFDASRKQGDMLIVDDVSAVNLYYFQTVQPAWKDQLQSTNASTQYNDWYTALAAKDGNGYTLNTGNLKFAG